ncbi:unnamed protein product [Rotaria sp. Silwood2]|nr:unnamed protein product [Rotaria sp. Silwood2]
MAQKFLVVIFQLCVLSMLFIHVASNTQSNKYCPIHSDALELEIQTGDKWLAGTDDNINLLLRSGNGMICREYHLDNRGNDRERNSIDKYNICCPEGFSDDYKEISMFALAHGRVAGKNGQANTND